MTAVTTAPLARLFIDERTCVRNGTAWVAFGVIWVLTLAPGFALLWAYEMRPGEAAGAPDVWPVGE